MPKPTPKILFVVDSDPRVSARPAGAMRLAAGLGAWQNVELQLYFSGDALLAFDESVELCEAEIIRRCLPFLTETDRPLLVPPGGKPFVQRASAPVFCRELDDAALAALAAESHSVLRF